MKKEKVTFVQDPDSGIIYREGNPRSFITAIYTKLTEIETELKTVKDYTNQKLCEVEHEIQLLVKSILNYVERLEKEVSKNGGGHKQVGKKATV